MLTISCSIRFSNTFTFLALVVCYAYFPNAQTLYEAHMKPKPPPTYQQAVYYGRHQQRHQQQLQAQQQVIPERTLWSYIIQLLSAIKKVHEQGQAVRMIDVSKVLVTGQNRFVLSLCSIFILFIFVSIECGSARVVFSTSSSLAPLKTLRSSNKMTSLSSAGWSSLCAPITSRHRTSRICQRAWRWWRRFTVSTFRLLHCFYVAKCRRYVVILKTWCRWRSYDVALVDDRPGFRYGASKDSSRAWWSSHVCSPPLLSLFCLILGQGHWCPRNWTPRRTRKRPSLSAHVQVRLHQRAPRVCSRCSLVGDRR